MLHIISSVIITLITGDLYFLTIFIQFPSPKPPPLLTINLTSFAINEFVSEE